MSVYVDVEKVRDAVEECTWYHINRNGRLVAGATSDYAPLYKANDIFDIIDGAKAVKVVPFDELEKCLGNIVWLDPCDKALVFEALEKLKDEHRDIK